jgi:hypothetical protein
MAALAIAGCEARVAPIEVAAGCPDQPLRGPSRFADVPQQRLIDDFEHDKPSLPRLGGRDGFWVLGDDASSKDVQAGVSDRCSGRGLRAGHFSGTGFSSWGANWTALLLEQPGGKAVPYAATAYKGFSFWAAASTHMPAPFLLPVGVTTMDVAWNGPVCKKCMDYYRTTVSVEHTWQRFEVRFSELEQSGSGDPLVPLRVDQLVGVIFWPDEDFDVWVDDLRFEQ